MKDDHKLKALAGKQIARRVISDPINGEALGIPESHEVKIPAVVTPLPAKKKVGILVFAVIKSNGCQIIEEAERIRKVKDGELD